MYIYIYIPCEGLYFRVIYFLVVLPCCFLVVLIFHVGVSTLLATTASAETLNGTNLGLSVVSALSPTLHQKSFRLAKTNSLHKFVTQISVPSSGPARMPVLSFLSFLSEGTDDSPASARLRAYPTGPQDLEKNRSQVLSTGVCEKNTPPERKTLGTISLKSTKSGAGEQFLPLDCMAKAGRKERFFHRHR